MKKLLKTIKNILYSDKTRQYTAVVAMVGLISPITFIGAPLTSAEDRSDNINAFLMAEALPTPGVIVFDNNDDDLILQDDIFIMASCLPGTFCLDAPDLSVNIPQVVGKKVLVTAYSSTHDQTDASPFITANGTYVYDGVVACNFLPFGTKIKFPEVYGDKIFTVQDRMASRNSHKIDIWMTSRSAALQFGVQKLAFEVIE